MRPIEQIHQFLSMLYQHVELDRYAVMLRGIGEPKTPQEGKYHTNVPFPLDDLENLAVRVEAVVEGWGRSCVASYMVPAALDLSVLVDRKGTGDRIRLFTSLCIDLDTGSPTKSYVRLKEQIGRPTMTVESGGLTPTEEPKLHLWWALTEPTADAALVGNLRERLALFAGGDPSFKRPTQVIRIPGTVYAKGGVARQCRIVDHDPARFLAYDLDTLAETIRGLTLPASNGSNGSKGNGRFAPGEEPLGWIEPAPEQIRPRAYRIAGGYDFSPLAGLSMPEDDPIPMEYVLTTDVHEGGGDIGPTGEPYLRFYAASRVIGHFIHEHREGRLGWPEAEMLTYGWNAQHMKPPWPANDLANHIRRLKAEDVKNHGELEQMTGKVVPFTPTPGEAGKPTAKTRTFSLADACDVLNWPWDEPEEDREIVQGLVMGGEPLVDGGEDGTGKTQRMLSLSYMAAIYEPGFLLPDGEPLRWMGGLLMPPAAEGTIVIVTAEDPRRNIMSRLRKIDKFDLLERTRGRLKILTLRENGGAFNFLSKSGAYAEARRTARWQQLIDELAAFDKLLLVTFDPLTPYLHGGDSDPKVVTEFFSEVNHVICGEMGAALYVPHHFRK